MTSPFNKLCGDYWANLFHEYGRNISIIQSVHMLGEVQRVFFYIFYSIIVSLSIVANVATFFATFHRKLRLMQKTLILSLALSDIIVCVFFGVNNLINFTHPIMSWLLGSFMCKFVPYMQIVGSIANSITMSSFAVDRYRNVVHPLTQQWDPKLWLCIILFAIIWIISAGVSFPMFTLNSVIPVIIFVPNPVNHTVSDLFCVTMCGTLKKQNNLLYYSIIFSIIFVPSMIMCLWLYYKIAQLIWRRRKPIGCKSSPTMASQSVAAETSTGTTTVATTSQIMNSSMIKTTKLHMENKIRTFKIVLVIMLVFFVCRMPHWLYALTRLSNTFQKKSDWIVSYALSCLLIFNTMLNPLLYSFLNETIKYFDKFFVSAGEFIVNICCCCCSNTEFEDFEKENPFPPEMYDPVPSQSSSMLPRGTYVDNTESRIKHVQFIDVDKLQIVQPNQKEVTSQCNTY